LLDDFLRAHVPKNALWPPLRQTSPFQHFSF
jgi:hypothetical protein